MNPSQARTCPSCGDRLRAVTHEPGCDYCPTCDGLRDAETERTGLREALPFIRWAVDSYRHGGLPPHFTQDDQVKAYLALASTYPTGEDR